MHIAPYGTWASPISAAMVAGTQLALGFPGLVDGEVWWSEGRPLEGGRVALMREAGPGRVVEVTPEGFNARTRINEYGGKAWAAAGGVVLAVSFQDQRIWRLDGSPRPISPDTGAVDRYGDLVIDRRRERVIAVRERLREGAESVHAIVALPLDGGPETVLVEGADFYAAPALAPDGERLAWLAWDHPDMPWDGAALFMGAPGTTPVRLAGGAGSSVVQPGWTADGRLVFAWDIEGIWRLWAWDGQGLRLLDPTGAEQAGPLWQLGSTWWDAAPDGRIVQARVREGFWSLAIDRVPVPAPFVELGEVRCDARHAVARAGFPDRPPAIVALDLRDRSWRVVRAAGPLELGPGWIAAARPVTAGEAHAFFYPPTNPDIAAPAGTRPPLIVRSHGGPTAAASPALKLAWQYWTSRGFALVDVNYRGSTGWGRGYREALNGQWGIADVEDCVAGRDRRRQRRRVHDAQRADLHRGRVPRRGQLVRDRRPRGALARHPQVREPLSRPAGRPLAGGGRDLPRPVADPPCRAADDAGPVPAGRGRPGRPAVADPRDGRGAAGEGRAGRGPALPGRGPRVPQGGDADRRARGRARVLPQGPGARLSRPRPAHGRAQADAAFIWSKHSSAWAA
jgi:dipeptidyl aminopeptidase/acylaminoacyl peptidase